MRNKDDAIERTRWNQKILNEFPFLWGIRQDWQLDTIYLQISRIGAEPIPGSKIYGIRIDIDKSASSTEEVWTVLENDKRMQLVKIGNPRGGMTHTKGVYAETQDDTLLILAKTKIGETADQSTISHVTRYCPNNGGQCTVFFIKNWQKVSTSKGWKD